MAAVRRAFLGVVTNNTACPALRLELLSLRALGLAVLVCLAADVALLVCLHHLGKSGLLPRTVASVVAVFGAPLARPRIPLFLLLLLIDGLGGSGLLGALAWVVLGRVACGAPARLARLLGFFGAAPQIVCVSLAVGAEFGFACAASPVVLPPTVLARGRSDIGARHFVAGLVGLVCIINEIRELCCVFREDEQQSISLPTRLPVDVNRLKV